MRYYLIIIIAFCNLPIQAKTLNIEECLELIDFEPLHFIEADLASTDFNPTVDIKNGYYEIMHNTEDIILCQAAKFDNKDGSISLMITALQSDEQCSRYITSSFLIFPEGDRYIEMGLEELNLNEKFQSFFKDEILNQLLEKLLSQLQGGYLSQTATVEDLYKEFYDFHYVLPRYGTALTITMSLCDYIPTNEIEITEEDWKMIKSSIPSKSMAYDKKFIKFK